MEVDWVLMRGYLKWHGFMKGSNRSLCIGKYRPLTPEDDKKEIIANWNPPKNIENCCVMCIKSLSQMGNSLCTT